MASSFNHESNQAGDEYYGEEEDRLDDFIVYSDDDEDDNALKKQKLHQQQDEQELEDVDGEEFEDDDEEEAPVGVQEILRLREQLKEKIRRKNEAMATGVGKGSSSVKQQVAPPAKDRFGTFFGPSRQSLAPRVIQEGSSSMMKELQSTRPRPRNDASLVSKAQRGASRGLPKPKTVTKEKRKADALRENRDYSSLFSDDADASPCTKEQTGNKPGVLVRGPVNSAGKNRAPNEQTAKLKLNGHGLKGAGAAPSSQNREHNKAVSTAKFSIAARKGTVVAAMKKTAGLQPSLENKRPHALPPGQRQQQSSQGQKLQPASRSQKLQSNGHHQGQRSGQNGSAEHQGRAKPAQKQLDPSSNLKASRPVEKYASKRKSDDEDGDYASISKEIAAIMGYDRSKYAGRDEDDSNMEADYASILKEERRSARLARQEDQEQLRLIEEEMRRERAKKRKKVTAKATVEVTTSE